MDTKVNFVDNRECEAPGCGITWSGPAGMCDRHHFEALRIKAEAARVLQGDGTDPPRICEPIHTTLPVNSAERKEIPLFGGLLRYFPAALAAAAKVSKVGNDKHNPGEELHHARGKSMDHGDCILRHLMDLPENFGRGVGYDEQGMPQVGYLVWRALALAQQWLEDNESAPLAPGAKK